MRRIVVVSCLLLSSWRAAGAQAAQATPFRAGQWGAEFTLANQAVGTLLRFRAPDRALALSVSGSGLYEDREGDGPGDQSATSLGVDLSWRRYRSLTSGVVGFGALGLRTSFVQNLSPGGFSRSFSAGPSAQVGAQWFVLPRVSIGAGASATLSLGRTRQRLTSGPLTLTQRSTTLGFAFGQFGLTGAVYF